MDYSLAIASLMKLEGAEESIKTIDETVRSLQERAKQAEILEVNVAKTLAENNVEGSDLKSQLEALSVKNKTTLTELEQYKTDLETLKKQNSLYQKRINIDKIAGKYMANADVIEKLLGDEEIVWQDDIAMVNNKPFDEYVDANLAAFKPSIFLQLEAPKSEVAPKLSSGSPQSESIADQISDYIKGLYKIPEYLTQR